MSEAVGEWAGEFQEGPGLLLCICQRQVMGSRDAENRDSSVQTGVTASETRSKQSIGGQRRLGSDKMAGAGNPSTEDKCIDHMPTRSTDRAELETLNLSQHKWVAGNSFALDDGQSQCSLLPRHLCTQHIDKLC